MSRGGLSKAPLGCLHEAVDRLLRLLTSAYQAIDD